MSDQYAANEPLQEASIFSHEPEFAQRASTGIRLANFVIDMIVAYSAVFGFMIVLTLLVPSLAETINESSDGFAFNLMDRVLTALGVATVFTLIEGFTKGRTLGKVVTGTVAVREDGAPFTWTDAVKRSFSRIVPFEPLSGLSGYPWHDKWSGTLVVKK